MSVAVCFVVWSTQDGGGVGGDVTIRAIAQRHSPGRDSDTPHYPLARDCRCVQGGSEIAIGDP
jgi:hypothetical protein